MINYREMINQNVIVASKKINKYIRKTPFERSAMISDLIGADVWLKMENQQHTGSFKFRGAINKMLSLSESERESGIYAASTGNHGAAVAYACQLLKVPCIIYVPENSSQAKLINMKNFGAEIVVHGKDCMDGELKAREVANNTGGIYLSPYNDLEVVAGQGTIGKEIESQCNGLDSIIVSVGGGGLISGVGGYLKSIWPDIEVMAASPENHAVMIKSLEVGEIIKINPVPTLSDGTAGGVEDQPPAEEFEDQPPPPGRHFAHQASYAAVLESYARVRKPASAARSFRSRCGLQGQCADRAARQAQSDNTNVILPR